MLFWQACFIVLPCSWHFIIAGVYRVRSGYSECECGGTDPCSLAPIHPSFWRFQLLMTAVWVKYGIKSFLILWFLFNVSVEFFCKECSLINQGYLVSLKSFHETKQDKCLILSFANTWLPLSFAVCACLHNSAISPKHIFSSSCLYHFFQAQPCIYCGIPVSARTWQALLTVLVFTVIVTTAD